MEELIAMQAETIAQQAAEISRLRTALDEKGRHLAASHLAYAKAADEASKLRLIAAGRAV